MRPILRTRRWAHGALIGVLTGAVVSGCTYSHYENPRFKAYKAALARWNASPHLYRGFVLLTGDGWSPDQVGVVRHCERLVLPIAREQRKKHSFRFSFKATAPTAGRVSSCLADVPGYDKAGTALLSSPPPVPSLAPAPSASTR